MKKDKELFKDDLKSSYINNYYDLHAILLFLEYNELSEIREFTTEAKKKIDAEFKEKFGEEIDKFPEEYRLNDLLPLLKHKK